MSPRSFDDIECTEIGPGLAESAFRMTGDWNGEPYHPPAAEQPGVYAWGEAHLQYAYLLQYRATGDARYLETLVRRFRQLLALRDDRWGARDVLRDRVMPAWGSVRFSERQYTCFIVHAAMLLYPAAGFLALAAESPALRERFASEIAEFTPAILETVHAFDPEWREGPEAGEGFYLDTAYGGQYLPLNQQNCLGRVLVQLAAATGEPAYRERAACLARYLKHRLVLRPDGAYQWQYRPPQHPPFDGPGEDISHAAMNVEYAVLCHQQGVVFTAEDLKRLAATFLQVVRKAPDRFAECVDGSGTDNRYLDVLAIWGNLAAADPAVITAIRDGLATRPPLTGPFALLTAAMLALHNRP